MTAETTNNNENNDISSYYESICYANAVKTTKSQKIGLVVKRSNTWDTLYISQIKDTSMFKSTKLQIGMVILTINGMKCPKTVKEIQNVMKETEGALTIMAATISPEISVMNASSPAHSPVRTGRPSATTRVVSADGSPEMSDSGEAEESPLSFRTEESYANDGSVEIGSPQYPLHTKNNMDKSSDNLTASTELSEPRRLESLEMNLDVIAKTSARPVSPPLNASPGSSPLSYEQERKVSESGLRQSPVNICSIDHTGNIVITPKQSPKESVPAVKVELTDSIQMPNLKTARSLEEEKKDDGSPLAARVEPREEEVVSSHSRAPHSEPVVSSHSRASYSEQVVSSHSRASTYSQPVVEEDSKPAARKSKTQIQQEQDDRAKKRASQRLSRGPQMAPGVAPGAYAVAGRRPSDAKSSHSLSPVPLHQRPGAHRVAGPNSRASDGNVEPLPLTPSKTVASAPARSQRRSMGSRLESLSPPKIPTSAENMPPPHPDIPRPGVHRITGPNRRRSNERRSPSPYSPASQYSSGPVDIDALEDNDSEEEILQGVGVGMGVPVAKAPSSIDGDLVDDALSKDNSFDSIEVSEAPEMSIITSDDIVVAAEVQEHPELVEDRIRQQILQETARAAVVAVEHGGKDDSEDEEEELHKPKNVKEKLFGGGGKGRDVSQELAMNPDSYICKRDCLPWNVTRNTTTNMWIASVVTDQKAYDANNKAEQERSKAVFSAKTEREAYETGLAMATPYLQPFAKNPICKMCSSKFAIFNKPHNCRNCGVVICSKCTVVWSSKRLPTTYQTSKSTHSVCLACDWSATKFQEAISQGKLRTAKKLYESGNINLRSPCISSKKKSGQEIMYPIHMAILGGNVELVRWLCKERFVPVTVEVKSRGAVKSLPIGTSKGRTPLKLAIKQKNHDMLKFLVSEMEVSLFEEDLKGDYRYLLAHLSNTLHRAPYESEIAIRKRQASMSSSSSPKSPTEAKVEYASTTGSGGRSVGSHYSANNSSRADSRGEC